MSHYSGKLCGKILEKYYGDIVAKVSNIMLHKGGTTFSTICKELPDIPKSQVIYLCIYFIY